MQGIRNVRCFNSIKVQLEQCGLYFLNPVVMFQFHKGSIRTHKLAEYAAVSEFQFHKGAIRTPATLDASGKVTLFQFHYGSIRTDYSNAENGDYCEFQFHYGSIRTHVQHMYGIEISFNSIMVQLEHL